MDDPLNKTIQLGGVETSMPLAPEGDYECQIIESSIDPNKNKTGYNWNMTLAAVNPITTIDGREIKNAKFFVNNIALQPSEESKDPEAFRRGVASAVDAILGTTKENRPDFDRSVVDSAVGKTVVANVYIDEYPQGSGNKTNKVRRLKKAA